MKTTVIYHSADFDGEFCREIARQFYKDEASFIGWDYGEPVPEIPADSPIVMLDISVPELMDRPGLVWIDHHKTAMERWTTPRGYRLDGVAACRLAWQWFHSETSPLNPTCKPEDWNLPQLEDYRDRLVLEPLAVQLAGEYDVFDHRDERALLFQHGLKSQPLNWFLLLDTTPSGNLYVEKLLHAGRALHFAKAQENDSIIRQLGFTLKWEGLYFLACNAARFNSQLFTAGIEPEHDALMGFRWDGRRRKWTFSLYGVATKPDLDLSVIAAKYGGGGHKQACGFELPALPFVLSTPHGTPATP